MISIPPKGDNEKRINAHFTPLMVEAQTSPDMTVKIRPGSFWTAMGTHVEYIGGISPILTAPTGDAKWIVISINGDGLVEVLNGVPGSNPDLPTIPETHIPLSGIFVGDTTLQITSDMVFDIRPMWSVRPENIPNLAGELASRPTATQMNAAIALKADMAGTNSPTFTLNQDHVGVTSTDAALIVERGSEPNVSIRWSETMEQWQFSNDGSAWGPIGMSAGVFYNKAELDSGALDGQYYEKSILDSGVLDSRYYTEAEADAIFASVTHTHVAADISNFAVATAAELSANDLNALQDVAYIAQRVDRDVMVWDGLVDNQWENRALVKADVSDFVELAYVHVVGAETIAGAKTFSDDMVVNGNLTINGTTTTVNSTDVAISDNIFVLNKDEVGAGVSLGTAGIEIKRGSEQDVMLYWDEATDTWRAHHNPGAGLVVDALSFQGHQHVLADLTDITVNALAVNQLVGISTTVTVQTQLNGKAALAVPVTAGNFASLTVLGDMTDSGVILDDNAVSVADLWSASKIGTELALKADVATPVFVGTVGLPTYVVAALPPQAAGHAIYVSNATTGNGMPGSMCFSNGVAWVDVTTGIAVV